MYRNIFTLCLVLIDKPAGDVYVSVFCEYWPM